MLRSRQVLRITVIVIAISLILGGLAFAYPSYKSYFSNSFNRGYRNDFYRGMGYGHMSGMMNSWGYSNNYYNRGEKISNEEIVEVVEKYISSIDNNLEVGDMFIFEDTDYYVSIEEKDTGKGAMELLINPYTGYIYPEFGPNMMWNEKYGMHGTRGFGMMGIGGWFNNKDLTKIDRETSINLANEYVKNNLGEKFSVKNKGHEFYGYYTFHIYENDETVGMLSVNYYSGDIWYHGWHGQLEDIIEHKE